MVIIYLSEKESRNSQSFGDLGKVFGKGKEKKKSEANPSSEKLSGKTSLEPCIGGQKVRRPTNHQLSREARKEKRKKDLIAVRPGNLQKKKDSGREDEHRGVLPKFETGKEKGRSVGREKGSGEILLLLTRKPRDIIWRRSKGEV